MPHHEVVAKCPYYVRENQTTIFCESGFFTNDGVARYAVHSFENSRDKVKYMKAFCGRYPDGDCPYARYMNWIYRED